MQLISSGAVLVAVAIALLQLNEVSGVSSNNNNNQQTPYVLHEWTTLDYEWQSEAQKERYVTELLYIPSNNVMTGIKVWKDSIYVTVPRWRPGVPSTLNKVVLKDGQPILRPFPSWEMQDLVTGLKYVQSMEIDSRGWMWILDVGRLNIFGTPDQVINGPASLVIYDLEKNCIVRKYVFPEDVVAHNASFLNDLVIDQVHGLAYISDTWGDGGIVVYDFINNRSRYWTDPLNRTTQFDPSATPVDINNRTYPLNTPQDGIALSPDVSTLYYCPLISTHLNSVPTSIIGNFNLSATEIAQHVTFHGIKGYSDGMGFSNNGKLYYGSLTENSVLEWDPTTPLSQAKVLVQNVTTSQWPDTFAFDGKGNLLYVSNRLQLWFFNYMTFTGDANFRIWVVPINGSSYLDASSPTYYGSCGDSGGDGLSKGAIIGISIGAFFFLVLVCVILLVLAGGIYALWLRKRSGTEMSYYPLQSN